MIMKFKLKRKKKSTTTQSTYIQNEHFLWASSKERVYLCVCVRRRQQKNGKRISEYIRMRIESEKNFNLKFFQQKNKKKMENSFMLQLALNMMMMMLDAE